VQFHPLLVSKGPQATGLKRRRGRREERDGEERKERGEGWRGEERKERAEK
jgi:hypothetical protein